MNKKIQGFKGEQPQPKPVEVQDTISSTGKAYIVDMLCEGEIEDLVRFYIDESEYNSTDFPTVEYNKTNNFRKGSRRTSQTILPGRFSGAKTPLPVPASNRLRKTRPITIYFNSNTYPDATSVLVNIRIPSLFRQVGSGNALPGETEGDVREESVEYTVTLTENGVARAPVREVIREKSTNGFVWSTRLNLNPDQSIAVNKWKIKIERVTADSTNLKSSNDTFLDSVIVQTSYNYNYPHTAVNALAFDAENFPNIGQRAYELKLLKVKIPSGYTPTQYDSDGNVTAAAIYPGTWNGTFSGTLTWTDNPAWIFYDLLTNKRYGLGEYIEESSIDKWTLFSIAKYCDELVDKGNGELGLDGLEPRFTCNLFLTTTEEAYTVINNLASVFRGITYWMSGKIFPVQDRPKNPVQLFTNANVINGIFNYSTTGKGQRRTVAQVRWNDPEDFYRPKIEYVEDTEGKIRFGVRELEIGAFACTSRGQAYRVGKWALLSERLETEVVSFETGTEAIYSRPGDIIELYDNFRVNQKQGGRTLDMGSGFNQIFLDRLVDVDSNLTYELSLSIPKANRDPGYTGSDGAQMVSTSAQIDDIRKSFIETSTVSSFTNSGNITICNTASGFSSKYIGGTWVLKAYHTTSGLINGSKLYRVLNLRETEEKNVAINALEYDSGKFDIAETGFTIRVSPKTDYGENPINAPTSLSLSQQFNYYNEDFSAYIQASWTASTGPFLSHHVASGRKTSETGWEALKVYENGSCARMFPTGSGNYEVIVAAVQVGGAMSSTISSTVNFAMTNPLGTSVIPIDQITLENKDDGTTNQYSEREPHFSILLDPTGSDGTDLRRAFLYGINVRFKTQAGAPTSAWTLIEEGESITVPYNFTGISGWPYRTGIIEARAMDFWGNFSPVKSLTFSNPAPSTANMTVVAKTQNSVSYIIEPTAILPPDFSGIHFWTNTVNSFPTGASTIKNALAGELTHNLAADQVYAWWALADDFSPSGLNINGPKLLEVGTLGTGPTSLTLSLINNLDAWANEHYTLSGSWDRMTGDIRDYYVFLTDTSGGAYNYIAPQTESGRPYFHFDSIVPDRTYTMRVRARNGEGRLTAYSSNSSGVVVPKPKIRFLQVEGKSYFFEPTYVRMHQQNISSDTNVDFGRGNIIRLNMSNSSTATLGVDNIQSGATYLIYMYRAFGAGSVGFSSNYKWPEGDKPDMSTTVGAVDVISAFAIDTGNLYAVAVNNMA